MKSSWSLSELTELDLKLRPGVQTQIPEDWDYEASRSASEALKLWLIQKRTEDPDASKLAASAVRSEAWFRVALLLFSLVAGAGTAAGLLRQSGSQLINVSAYLGVLIGGQLLLLLGLALTSVWIHSRKGILEELFLPSILREMSDPISIRAWKWKLFTTFQTAGIAFNLGVLAATFWKVVAFDLAFGWATTLRVDEDTLEPLTGLLAAPWGGAFAPTAEQIRESRIVLLDGFTTVTPESTAAWWPFLMMCVAAYGLLPRALLTGFGVFRLQREVRFPMFGQPRVQRFLQQLQRKPLLQRTGSEKKAPSGTAGSLQALTPAMPLFLEVPDDLSETHSPASLEQVIRESFPIELTADPLEGGRIRIVEVWQPPLEEDLRALRNLRTELGDDRDLMILAVGYPDKEGSFAPPDPADVQIWGEKLSELKDPHLGLLVWGESS